MDLTAYRGIGRRARSRGVNLVPHLTFFAISYIVTAILKPSNLFRVPNNGPFPAPYRSDTLVLLPDAMHNVEMRGLHLAYISVPIWVDLWARATVCPSNPHFFTSRYAVYTFYAPVLSPSA